MQVSKLMNEVHEILLEIYREEGAAGGKERRDGCVVFKHWSLLVQSLMVLSEY